MTPTSITLAPSHSLPACTHRRMVRGKQPDTYRIRIYLHRTHQRQRSIRRRRPRRVCRVSPSTVTSASSLPAARAYSSICAMASHHPPITMLMAMRMAPLLRTHRHTPIRPAASVNCLRPRNRHPNQRHQRPPPHHRSATRHTKPQHAHRQQRHHHLHLLTPLRHRLDSRSRRVWW